MDACNSDADFDSYWEEESRNKNRNRIRVGRQYQATVPPLLKPGETDGRRCEDLETLKWKPDNTLSDLQLDQYLSMARAVSLFAKAINNYRVPEKASDISLQTALRGLSDFVTSHHPCHHDAGCQVPSPSGEHSSKCSVISEWTPAEAHLFSQALEACGKNFGAIKKEFLPWKPVKSIIEYYYHGKGDKSDISPSQSSNVAQPSGSKEVPNETNCEAAEEKVMETEDKKVIKETKMENIKCEKVELSEVEDIKPDIKDTISVASTSSTVGSLKFYFEGKLVLKLNAQQENKSGNAKCQWVQSQDTPKISFPSKRIKHKKKSSSDLHCTVLPSSSGEHVGSKKMEGGEIDSSCMDSSESDAYVVKKAKLKDENTSEHEASFSVLYSSSWTPPVADGKDTVEMDDGSSKASEDHPIPSPRYSPSVMKCEIKSEVQTSVASGAKYSESETVEVKYDLMSDKVKLEPSSVFCPPQSYISMKSDDSASSEHSLKTDTNSNSASLKIDASCNKEMQCKSALFRRSSSTQVKGALYNSSTQSIMPIHFHNPRGHSKSQHKDRFSMPAQSCCFKTALQTPAFQLKTNDIPLDLSKKPILKASHTSEKICQAKHNSSPRNVMSDKNLTQEDTFCEHSVISNEIKHNSPVHNTKSSSCGTSTKDKSMCAPSSVTKNLKDGPTFKNVTQPWKAIDNVDSKGLKGSKPCFENKSQLKKRLQCTYPCCDVTCGCTVFPQAQKCTEECSKKDDFCSKEENDNCKKLQLHSQIQSNILQLSRDSAPDKASNVDAWFSSPFPYLQFYSQCYPYCVAYSMPSSSPSNASVTENPVDLSSSGDTEPKESLAEELTSKEKELAQNSEALERGMLYQLLKNKNAK